MEQSHLESIREYPRRIICLTEETTETLFLLGAQDRIVGVSGYTVRPPEARQKPKVSAFINAKFDRILSLEPDLVLAFSDLQASIAAELIRRGVTVFTFNQRSVAQILEMVLTLARLVGCETKGIELVEGFKAELQSIAAAAAKFPYRPKVFFEEWNEPLISGIRWVEELIEVAGGRCLFPELRQKQSAKDRVVDPAAVAARKPDLVIGSWCGVRFNPDFVRARPNWADLEVVKSGRLCEIKASYILQPGPAALTEGVRQLHFAIARTVGINVDPQIAPHEKTDPALGDAWTPFQGPPHT